MTPEQFVAILTALAAVLGAVAVCIGEVRRYHQAVNSKMDALLALTASSSHAEGLLEGRKEPAPDEAGSEDLWGRWSARTRRGHN